MLGIFGISLRQSLNKIPSFLPLCLAGDPQRSKNEGANVTKGTIDKKVSCEMVSGLKRISPASHVKKTASFWHFKAISGGFTHWIIAGQRHLFQHNE